MLQVSVPALGPPQSSQVHAGVELKSPPGEVQASTPSKVFQVASVVQPCVSWCAATENGVEFSSDLNDATTLAPSTSAFAPSAERTSKCSSER
jgi:hypothetical protein